MHKVDVQFGIWLKPANALTTKTVIIGLSKYVNDYQLSIIDSIDYRLTEFLLNVACHELVDPD